MVFSFFSSSLFHLLQESFFFHTSASTFFAVFINSGVFNFIRIYLVTSRRSGGVIYLPVQIEQDVICHLLTELIILQAAVFEGTDIASIFIFFVGLAFRPAYLPSW